MYDLYIKPNADRIFKKLSRKDRRQLLMVHKKIQEIREKPHHEYKHLRKPLEDFYRVHIGSSFVLIFAIDHADQRITIYYNGHHDDVCQWRPKKE